MSEKALSPGATAEVVIIGGGVIGLTTARALARRGVQKVTLFERGAFGAEASWAAAGILAPQVEADGRDEFFQLACASRDMYPEFAAALHEESGVEIELDRAGTLYLGFTEEAEREFKHRAKWQGQQGLEVEFLTARVARALEPQISESVRCALRFPNDWQVENRKLVKALVAANEKLGVQMLAGCQARSIRTRHEQVEGVETSQGHISTKIAVMAAGAWVSYVDSPDVSLPEISIEPVRGQMLCFNPGTRIAGHVIYSGRGYVVPRHDGRLLAGSTSDRVGFDKRVTIEGTEKIKSIAAEIVPALKHLSAIDSWAGFRPRAEDDLPVLGPSKEIGGLFYATGHYRNGILLAPITGELVADAIVTGVKSKVLNRFSPDRLCRKPDREGRHTALANARTSDASF